MFLGTRSVARANCTPIPCWLSKLACQSLLRASSARPRTQRSDVRRYCPSVGPVWCTCAQVGSCFELAAKNPLFGIIQPDSPLYYPILGVFILTGLPTASVLWGKAIKAANEETERMDRMDGY